MEAPKLKPSKIETNRENLREESKKEAVREQEKELRTVEKPKTKPPKPIVISPAARQLAASIGLDVDAIAKGAKENETRLKNLETAVMQIAKHIEASDEKLKPLVDALEKAQAVRAQAQTQDAATTAPNPIPGGLNVGSLMQMLPAILGGGGVDEEMRALNMSIMKMSLKRMESDIGFTEAIKQAMVTKIAGKAAADLV